MTDYENNENDTLHLNLNRLFSGTRDFNLKAPTIFRPCSEGEWKIQPFNNQFFFLKPICKTVCFEILNSNQQFFSSFFRNSGCKSKT